MESGKFVPPTSSQDAKTSISADQILANLQVNQFGETFSGGDVSVSEIAASGEWSEEKRKQIAKNIQEKHTLECVQHENEMRENEVNEIKEVLDEYQKQENDSVEKLKKELGEKLCSVTSDEEKESILDDYSRKMEETVNELENEKEDKLKDVRENLKRERRRKKKELYK